MQIKILKVFSLMLAVVSSLILTWCFHVPEKDRIFSENEQSSEIGNNFKLYQPINITDHSIELTPSEEDINVEYETTSNIDEKKIK